MEDLNQVLNKILALKDVPEPYVLKQLTDLLRVQGNNTKAQNLANKKIKTLIELLQQNPEYATGLATFLLTLLNTHHRMSIFTDTGISDYGFFNNLSRLVSHRFIPLLPDEDDIIELVDYIFDGRQDEQWLALITPDTWETLVNVLSSSNPPTELVATVTNNLLNAIVILSYRVNGLGLHQDLFKAYPEMVSFSAAFIAQNQEAILFANQYREEHSLEHCADTTANISSNTQPSHTQLANTQLSIKPMLVMLEQCDDVVNTIRKRIYKTGISIRLTNMLLRLEQSIHRLRNLGELLSNDSKQRDKAIIELSQAVILSVNNRYSIGHLISTNTELLSRKVTENAGRVGQHYISTDKSGFKMMFKKAAIGGFVIAFMATLKILSYDLNLAPMGRAFVNSMIYGLGFVFIHIIHGTVATKQPAMTAAAIASTIFDSSGKKSHQLAKLSELMVDILRTQFIAIMGNVLLAMPLAFIISYVWIQVYGTPMISFDKAEHLIADLNPLTSLALFHAAIAGVFLFLAGLIAGFYDNLAVFNRIGQRISRHRLLLKVLPARLTERLGRFVEANLGAIMGNFLFGVFLGSTATVGYIFGLPLDIRHIAFSSANFAHGFFNIPPDDFSYSLLFISLLGVALIGIMNLMVSFSLALIVALRSKNVHSYEWGRLSKLLITHLFTHPRDFVWPRPEPMTYSYIDSSGQIIHQDGEDGYSGHANIGHANTQYSTSTELGSAKLSDIRVVPDNTSIDSEKIAKAKAKKEFHEKMTDPKIAEANTKPKKKVTLSDDTMAEQDAAQTSQDKGHEDASKKSVVKSANSTSLDSKSADSTIKESESGNTDATKQIKESLPKPKKPPKLPD